MSRAYAILTVLVLSFGTALSILWFETGFGGAEYVIALKDAMLAFGVLIIALFRLGRIGGFRMRDRSADWILLVLLFVNLISFALSNAELSLRIVNLRRNLSLFVCLWIFWNLGRNPKILSTISKLSFAILFVVAVVGLVEYFCPDSLWNRTIDIPGYWKSIELDPFATDRIADSGRFYTDDLTSFVGHSVRRMVSFYAEPTTLAAFFVAMFCWSYAGRSRWIRLAIVLAGLLTFSKFFVLSVLFVIAIKRFADRLSPRLMLYCYGACVLISVLILGLGIQSGALNHVRGIVSLYQLVSKRAVLGFGLGGGGNYSANYQEETSIGAESGIGNIVAQMGVLAIAYLWSIARLYRLLLARWRQFRSEEYLVGILMLVSWVLSFFLSASSLGLSGNAFIFMYLGLVLAIDPNGSQRLITLSARSHPVLPACITVRAEA